jgi:hypothetical protein
MIVSSMRLPVFSSGTMRWTSLRETCARLTLISRICLTASHRRYTMLAVWRGGPARVAKGLITLAWT